MPRQPPSEPSSAPRDQAEVDETHGLPEGRWWRRPGDRPIVFNTALRMLRKRKHGRLLDVGCGQGQFARRASKYFEVEAIDISPARVQAARAYSGLSHVSVGSATALAYPSDSFDVVTALDVVEHLPQPSHFLSEAGRVLTDGGLILFSTPNPTSLGHRVKGQRSYMYSDLTHVSLLPPSEWRRLVAEAGFTVVREGTDLLWDPPYTGKVPASIQRPVFLALAQALFRIDIMYPWQLGENYWCLARSETDADRNRRG